MNDGKSDLQPEDDDITIGEALGGDEEARKLLEEWDQANRKIAAQRAEREKRFDPIQWIAQKIFRMK
jgi:hypothetical protein